MKHHHSLPLILFLALILALPACIGDRGGDDDDTADDDDAANDDDAADDDDDAADDDDTTAPPEGDYELVVAVSTTFSRHGQRGGGFSAACFAYDLDDGRPSSVATTLQVDPEPDSTEGDLMLYEADTEVTVHCSSDVDDSEAEITVQVYDTSVDPAYGQAAELVGQAGWAVEALRTANGGLIPEIEETINNVEVLVDGWNPSVLVGVPLLRPLPEGDYPSQAALDAAGYPLTDDDDSWSAAIQDLQDALEAVQVAAESFPRQASSEVDLAVLENAALDLQLALDAATALSPSPGGVLREVTNLETLLGSAAPQAAAGVSLALAEATRGHMPDEFPAFWLIDTIVSVAGVSSLQLRLINQIYGPFLQEIQNAMVTMAVADLIDYLLPPAAGAPRMEFVFASASLSFASPGYNTWIQGTGFPTDPSKTRILILSYQLIDDLISLVIAAYDTCTAIDWDVVNDIADLEAKAIKHSDSLAALMVTYPSTHGVFESGIVDITRIVHEHGGQVYLDRLSSD